MAKQTAPEENPWTFLKKRPIYDNPWINVEEHDVLNPAGGKGIYGLVQFKNLAIGIIPIDQNGYTWLVGQYRYALNQYSWEIPMGGGPLHIDPLTSAQRELQEETGLTAQKWTELLTIHTSNSVTNELGYVYVAEGLTQGPMAPEETEELAIKHLPLAQAVEMAHNGQITDGVSLAALLKIGRIKGL